MEFTGSAILAVEAVLVLILIILKWRALIQVKREIALFVLTLDLACMSGSKDHP